ncbi:MAG: nucleotidyl transferase AbiEii/AbiGii toxin family protein [Bacteroidota bacterium]
MIDPYSFSPEWLDETSSNHNNADKNLIEKTIRAMALLEQLRIQGLDLIFKGGTSLFLYLDPPKRFSIDIDIVLHQKTPPLVLKDIFDKIVSITLPNGEKLFHRWEEKVREQKDSNIDKAHYKFFYQPQAPRRPDEEPILLDIVFEENSDPPQLIEKEILTPFLLTKKPQIFVIVPSLDSLLGDKITAFAPNTVGKPYGNKLELEIIKQLFDVGILFDYMQDLSVVRGSFLKAVGNQMSYRPDLHLSLETVYDDIFKSCLLLSSKGHLGEGIYDELKKGVERLKNHIWYEKFHLEKAITHASKVAYLSELLQSKEETLEIYSNPQEIISLKIESPEFNRLNKMLKKGNPEAFFYWYQTIQLREARLN